MSEYQEQPREAYVLSIVGGILIAAVGLSWIIPMLMGWNESWFDWLDNLMHGVDDHSHFWGFGGYGYVMGLSGFVLGIGVVLASVMLKKRPDEHGTWGVVIIILSAVSVIGGMGGMVIGLLLGIVGGILAVLWQPPSQFYMHSNQD
ncbi:MAG: DUF6114 domain-containing protein [Candidatus Thorarchaeota archaeon]